MTKPSLLLIILALAGVLTALWQSQDDRTTRDLPLIQALSVSADGGLTLSGTFARDCSASLRTEARWFARNLDFQVTRDRSSRAACGMQASAFVIELPAQSARAPVYVIVNNEAWFRASDEAGADNGYERQRLYPVHVDDARLAIGDSGEAHLTVRGSQAIGCDLPELISLREAEASILIGVHNAMPADGVCPAMLVEVDETFAVSATELPADTLFAVNAFLIDEVETIDVNDSEKVLTNIIRVAATVNRGQPAQISLQVEGEHPDGCDLPVHAEQSRTGDTVKVEIYRKVPADMICPMILRPYEGEIQLEGDFAPGSYTIMVNSHSQTLDI